MKTINQKLLSNLLLCIIFILNSCNINSSNNKNYSEIINETKKIYPKTEVLIIIDFKIHSGKNRLFVYDLNTNKLLLKSLCTHGNGLGSTKSSPIFSNKIGSHCSSLGYFKVSGFNITGLKLPSYLLDGLNSTNNNARKRHILIHPYYTVPNHEIYPFYLDMNTSWGCFITSPESFKRISRIIKNKNTLIYSVY